MRAGIRFQFVLEQPSGSSRLFLGPWNATQNQASLETSRRARLAGLVHARNGQEKGAGAHSPKTTFPFETPIRPPPQPPISRSLECHADPSLSGNK